MTSDEHPQRRATDHHHGWTSSGRRRWDLPPNVTKVLLAMIPVLLAAIAALKATGA